MLRSMRQTIAKTQHIAESRTRCGCHSAFNPDLYRQATLETRCLAPSLCSIGGKFCRDETRRTTRRGHQNRMRIRKGEHPYRWRPRRSISNAEVRRLREGDQIGVAFAALHESEGGTNRQLAALQEFVSFEGKTRRTSGLADGDF